MKSPYNETKKSNSPTSAPVKIRLSFKEKQEFQSLEKEIEELNAEKTLLETELSQGHLSPDELIKKSERIGQLIEILDEKEMRWLELSEISN